MWATPDQITMAMNLYFSGESSRKTAHHLSLLESRYYMSRMWSPTLAIRHELACTIMIFVPSWQGDVTSYHVTVQGWIKKYVGLMDTCLDRIIPQVGENWRTDELYLKIRMCLWCSVSLCRKFLDRYCSFHAW